MISGWGISWEIALKWMPLDLTDGWTLGQVMAWCRKATSHYLSQCWPRLVLPYGTTRPQWVKIAIMDLFYIIGSGDVFSPYRGISHYLNQLWSRPMMPCGTTRLQWVKWDVKLWPKPYDGDCDKIWPLALVYRDAQTVRCWCMLWIISGKMINLVTISFADTK